MYARTHGSERRRGDRNFETSRFQSSLCPCFLTRHSAFLTVAALLAKGVDDGGLPSTKGKTNPHQRLSKLINGHQRFATQPTSHFVRPAKSRLVQPKFLTWPWTLGSTSATDARMYARTYGSEWRRGGRNLSSFVITDSSFVHFFSAF